MSLSIPTLQFGRADLLFVYNLIVA
jgi:hypothetical protein